MPNCNNTKVCSEQVTERLSPTYVIAAVNQTLVQNCHEFLTDGDF